MSIESIYLEIEKFIQMIFKKSKKSGIVIALSGGLDSSVVATLVVRSVGRDKVHLVNFPDKDSNPIHKKHAKYLAQKLNVTFYRKNITPILRKIGSYRFLPIRFIPNRKLKSIIIRYARSHLKKYKNDQSLLINRIDEKFDPLIAKGNVYAIAKHRTRVILTYQYAELRNLMVMGAANLSELLTGTFSKWGIDHCADVMPIVHLYRTQVEELAKFMEIPEFIRNKPADPDVVPGIPDKGSMLGGFATLDKILSAILENTPKSILFDEYGERFVKDLIKLIKHAESMRKIPKSLLSENQFQNLNKYY